MNNSLLTMANSLNQFRWIGLATIKPQEGNDILGECSSALVPVVGDAINKDEFTKLVEIEFAKLDFNLEVLEDVEKLSQRLETHELSDELETAIISISFDNPIILGTFQAF